MRVILFILIVIFGSISQASVVAKISNKKVLLSAQQYKPLPQLSKKDYIRSLRSAFLDIEKQQKFKGKAIEYSHISVPIRNSEMFAINWLLGISEALADDVPRCVIGGLIRKMVRADPSSRFLCPTYGRSCAGESDTFKCGLIFNEVCVPRFLLEGLSERCASSAGEKIPDSYIQFKQDYENALDQVCPPESESVACIKAKDRIKSFNSDVLATVETPSPDSASTEDSPQPPTASDQVATFCHGSMNYNEMLSQIECGSNLKSETNRDFQKKLAKVLACSDCANIKQNLENIRVKNSGENFVLDINSKREATTIQGLTVNLTADVSEIAKAINCRRISGSSSGHNSGSQQRSSDRTY